VVLLFSGLNFIGYLARRSVGDRQGYPLVGALGGLVSSTAVTFGFSRQSRREPESAIPLAIGTVAACVVLFPRVIAVATVLNPDFAGRIAVRLAPMLIGAAVMLVVLWKRQPPPAESNRSAVAATNPLQLLTAIRMAVLFQVVLIVMTVIRARFGNVGLKASAAIVGLTDIDALTFGMSRVASDAGAAEAASGALLLGIVVNTLLKAAIALFGDRRYRVRVTAALLVTASIGAFELWR
jgi:uncharacterized membrane protein (DUF4010 family)